MPVTGEWFAVTVTVTVAAVRCEPVIVVSSYTYDHAYSSLMDAINGFYLAEGYFPTIPTVVAVP